MKALAQLKLPPAVLAQVARFEALPLRQRLITSACACALCALVIDTLFVAPAEKKYKDMQFIVAGQQAEFDRASAELAAMQAGNYAGDPQLIAQLASLKQEIADIDSSLSASNQHMVTPQQVPALLSDLLRSAPGVELLALDTLAPHGILKPDQSGPVAEAEVLAAGEDEKPAMDVGTPNLFRHGVRISMRGNYLDVTEALARIEALPWRLYWGQLSMQVPEAGRPVFSVTLYTLSLEKSWLKL